MMLAPLFSSIAWMPDSASTVSRGVDSLFFALLIVSGFFTVVIFGCILVFSWRYRRGSNANRDVSGKGVLALELTWTIIPVLLGLWLFTWGAKAYVNMTRIPKDAMEVYVVGKQWMWKVQHAEGPREINELHVPVGKPVKLLMISQDVIHSFFVPAFRSKRDVLPGRFEAQWFEAAKPGEYHLFCAEYCGTEHSRMRGRIVAMAPEDYARWISENQPQQTAADFGATLFHQFACNSCHGEENSERGPALAGVFGTRIQLNDGRVCEADESYLAEAIVNASSKIVSGYSAKMPSYKGQIDEEQVVALVAYLKALKRGDGAVVKLTVRDASTRAYSVQYVTPSTLADSQEKP